MVVGGQHQFGPRTRRMTRYTLYRRQGGLQSQTERVRKITLPVGFNSRTVQPVARRYTDYDIQPHRIRVRVYYVSVYLPLYTCNSRATNCTVIKFKTKSIVCIRKF